MDYKEIVKLQQDYCESMGTLRAAIIAWLGENIKEGEYLDFENNAFHVLDEDDSRTKSSLCVGVGNSADIGGVYCQVKDGYELWPEDMDPIDLYNVAFTVNYILSQKKE